MTESAKAGPPPTPEELDAAWGLWLTALEQGRGRRDQLPLVTQTQASADEPTRSDSSESVRGFFGRDLIYTALWASQMGLATAVTAVVTRILGPAEYGIAAACITIMQVVSAVAGFGLYIAVQRTYASRGDDAARQLLLLTFVVSGVVYAVIALTGGLWAPRIGLGRFDGAASYTVLWAGLWAVTNAALSLLRSRDQLMRFVIVNVLQTAVAEVLSLVLILTVSRTATNYILGEMLAQAAALIAAMIMTRPLGLWKRDLGLVKDAVKFSGPLVPQMVAMFVLSASDRLVVNALAGHYALGRYAVASNLGSIPAILISSLAASWMPRVFSLSVSGDLSGALRHTRDLLYVLLVPVLCAIAIASPLLLRIWAPAAYRPDGLQIEVAFILTAAIPFAATTTHERILLAHDRTRANAVATALAAAVNLGLNLVLVPPCGILGSAIATLVAICVMNGLLWRASSRVSSLPYPSFAVMAWIAGGIALMFGAVLIPTSLPFLVLRGLLAVVIASSAIFILRAIRPGGTRGSSPQSRLVKWLTVETVA